MNYLVLRGLYLYYYNIPSAKMAYENIRSNVVKTVYNAWNKTHIFYSYKHLRRDGNVCY